MDPFTQRMLERARARQEKIDKKLASSGQAVPKRKPLSENVLNKTDASPIKSSGKVSRESITSPKRTLEDTKTESPSKLVNRRSNSQKTDQSVTTTQQRPRNDVIVTKKQFKSPKKDELNRRNSDVSVEINISHRDDIQIEVQVDERDAPITILYNKQGDPGCTVQLKEIEENTTLTEQRPIEMEHKPDRGALRHNIKSRLDRLGNLYSDKPDLSSPIHRTEQDFSSETPPPKEPHKEKSQDGKKKFGRLAALADQINNWEDDLTHHTYNQPEPQKKNTKSAAKEETLEASTLDVSIHSLNDINKVLKSTPNKSKQTSNSHQPANLHTFNKPPGNQFQKLNKQIVAELEDDGYRRLSTAQSRLVYDFSATNTADPTRQEPKCVATPSAALAPKMATMVASSPPANPTVAKKPSIKKYKAPTPPQKLLSDDECDSEKDKENNVVPKEENHNETVDHCIQTKPKPADKPVFDRGSPVTKRLAPKINGNAERNSVLSKAAMFETGSPRAKDPAEMSLRERKALFEKNKGAAIIPKAPFGLAPSVKTLHGDKECKPKHVQTPTKSNNASTNSSRTNSKDNIPDDNISQSSVGGGIKGKLAALFSKEQTISESTIANKFKQEREKEMEMLQNRFQYKPKPPQNEQPHDSDDDQSEHDPSEKAPLMGSTASLSQSNKPEIIANIPKVTFENKTRSEINLRQPIDRENESDKVIGTQPVKRRSSQDSPVVLSVLEDVKRIKVNDTNKEAAANGAILQQPNLYPNLADIETDNSHSHEEYSDCGGSSTEDVPEKVKETLNKSDDWAETSFGREVMKVVKKNNTSYQKAVRESYSDSSRSACDSELDDLIDEALNHEDGPTPPKHNKERAFKSPLKAQAGGARSDRGGELVHSVSFYRRMQNASSAPSTPVRVVRHSSPERAPPAPAQPPAVTVRQRIAELHNEVAKQQTVISQASQALNLCAATIEFSGSTEQAEGERLLLLATHRRQACLHEVQRLQVEGAGPAAAAGTATLLLQNITVPLRRDYIRQLNADGAVGHHAVCLVKCRDRVLATSMQLTQPSAPLLHFPDEIRMMGLTSDFKVTVEVYLLQASKEVLPHDVKYHIFNKKSSSKLLTPKSKTSALKAAHAGSPGGPHAVRSPQLQPHGYCIFALPQAKRKTFTLNKVPHGSPLEGSLSVDIGARVVVPPPPPHCAFLTAFDDVSGLGAWHRRWFRLQPPTLAYWKYPDDVHKKPPIGDIDLSTVVSERVVRAPREMCARPNTLLMECAVEAGLEREWEREAASLVHVRRADGTRARRHLLAADTPPERDAWLSCLNAALEYTRCCEPDSL